MRILVATSTFPVRLDDGTPRFVYDLAEALAAHAEVTVLAPDAPGAARRERMGSVEVRRLSYFWPRRWQRLKRLQGMRDSLRVGWLAKLQAPLYLLRLCRSVKVLTRRTGADVVNAHWIVPQGLAAAWARGRSGRFRLVLHVHAGDVYFLCRLPLGRAVARYVVSRCDVIFADGSHVRQSLDELLDGPSGAKLQTMGVDRRLFSPSRRETAEPLGIETPFADGFLLFFGRMTEKKGAIYVIRALETVRRRYDVGLVLIGSGPEEARLRDEAERLGLSAAVRFAGRKTHAEIARHLHACRLAVVPSIIDSVGETEGMPTVVVEAMAAGVRVVASAVDGIPDVVRHGENGWLCREKDPADLAEKILAALADPSPSPVVREALQTAEHHDWRQVAQNYMDSLQPLGEERAGR